jgi:hypothetical protein
MDPLWPQDRRRSFLDSHTALAFAFSLAIAFALHCFALSSIGLPRSSIPPPVLNDGSPYYGKPLITVGAIPFGVGTDTIVNQFQVSIGSWLRASAQVVVHLYDIVGGMGPLSPRLLERLQLEFGSDRVFVRGTILKKLRIETLPEAFEIIEKYAETVYAAWFSNDMILGPEWMDYVYAAQRYFADYKNFSMHFPRRDLFESCRGNISIDNVATMTWSGFFFEFRKRCRSRLHTLGYDCYLWNLLGINMTAAHVEPFFIGRPNFDGAIIRKQLEQGWYVTTYPWAQTYHMEHPDRKQFTHLKKHPDSVYNAGLLASIGGREWRNDEMNISLSLNEISERRSGAWMSWKLDRPHGTFPLAYPADSRRNATPALKDM